MRYVIVGNGVAGITAAFTIRAREQDAAITVISGESDYFFSRTALMYAFLDRLTRRDLEPHERKVYDQQRITRVRDRVVDLDAAAHSLTLESGRSLTYDRLLLATGSLPNRPAWTGLDQVRDGVVHFVTLEDLDNCERLTQLGHKAVVVGGGLIGIELVECLRHHGMDVTFLVRDPWYWPAALGEPEGQMITAHIRKHGVHISHEEVGEQIHVAASGRVTGIGTVGGRLYECSLLGIAIGVHPAIEWLAPVKTPPAMQRGIVVDPGFRTSLPDVWAAGDCAEFHFENRKPLVEQIWYSAKRHGELAAKSMLGDAVTYSPPVFYNSSKFFDIEYTTTGSFGPAGSQDFYSRIPGKDVSIRIAEAGGMVTGFNMLGSRWDHNFFERWIAERRSLGYVMEHLHLAQFDVEFGRQNLAHIRQQYSQWTQRARAVA